MYKLFERFYRNFKSNLPAVLLAFFWLLGIAIGYFCAVVAERHTEIALSSYIADGTSVLRLWIIHLFPFILVAFAYRFSQHYVIYFLNLVKSAIYSFCNFYVIFVFGSAGWLVRVLLLFTDTFSVLLLFYFSLGCLYNRSIGKSEYIAVFFSVAVLCLIDCFSVSPFLLSLFSR